MCCLICNSSELDLMKLKSPNMIVNNQRWNPKILSLAPGLCFDFHPNVRPTLKTVVHLTYAYIISESCERDLLAHAVTLQDSKIYLAGTEEGHIHKCSYSYNEQFLETYKAHTVCRNVCLIFKVPYMLIVAKWSPSHISLNIYTYFFLFSSAPFPRVRYIRLHGHHSVQTFS